MTQQTQPYGLLYWAFALLLFAVGGLLHLDLPAMEQDSFIFGDEGDGFFNTWVMEHNLQTLTQGSFDFYDGDIFWPDNERTLLWSDNLFVPSLFYGVLRLSGEHPFSAFKWTALLFAFIGYAAYLFFFYSLLELARERFTGLPDVFAWTIPVFAYLAAFSLSRLMFFQHFQNLAVCWIFFQVGAGLAYFRVPQRRWIAIMAIAQVLLLYSTPYFAVAGICFLLAWGGVLLMHDPHAFSTILRRDGLVLAPCGAAFAYLMSEYLRVSLNDYPVKVIRDLAIRFRYLYQPPSGLLHNAITRVTGHPLDIPHEAPAYLGMGLTVLLLGALIALPMLLVAHHRTTRTYVRYAWLLIPPVLFMLFRSQANGFWLVIGLIATLELIAIPYILVYRHRQSAWACGLGVLVLGVIIFYGLAFGPDKYYLDRSLNPSVWGLLRFVPGVRNMRAVGRMAVIGQGLLLGGMFLGLAAWLAVSHRRVLPIATAAILVLVQVIDQDHAMAYIRHFDPAIITPTAEEREALDPLEGVVTVFPTRPWHMNTGSMLYFVSFPNLKLINGYSSHSTQRFDEIMEPHRHRSEPSGTQLKRIRREGCDYAVFMKKRMPLWMLEKLSRYRYPVVYDGDRLLIFALNPER